MFRIKKDDETQSTIKFSIDLFVVGNFSIGSPCEWQTSHRRNTQKCQKTARPVWYTLKAIEEIRLFKLFCCCWSTDIRFPFSSGVFHYQMC